MEWRKYIGTGIGAGLMTLGLVGALHFGKMTYDASVRGTELRNTYYQYQSDHNSLGRAKTLQERILTNEIGECDKKLVGSEVPYLASLGLLVYGLGLGLGIYNFSSAKIKKSNDDFHEL